MAIPRIISRSDFTNYVEVAANLVDAKLFPRILEAENFDLCGLMGDAFFYDFIAQFDSAGIIDPDASQYYKDLYHVQNGHYSTNYQIQQFAPYFLLSLSLHFPTVDV